ncbi:GIT1 [Symbiodinium necroappetens]|uniref:GIT1 protein n=1 Tax=Symbiodinium necroappetens TaxID=1628268 RepID=A0A812RVR6_9DINO|nr:GIT1 [Symbiodinium necroappetens]
MARILSALATGIGLLTDKYMLGATNFVEHYALEFHATDSQKDFVKAAMYAGCMLGMIVMGPASDYIGRRLGLILCSGITLLGALLSALAWSENALIAARIITGVGMGGEYPLASAHSAESSEKTSDGARNIALLYLFGSGFGQALCPLVTYIMEVSGVPHELLWRWIFGVGVILSACGLVLRYLTTQNSQKFVESKKAERKHHDSMWTILSPYWRALLGTAGCWFLFDIVEYGLKQNDAAIFSENASASYAESILQVLWSRLLVIPSLIFAPWFLTKVSSKRVQLIGFIGCGVANLILAVAYEELREFSTLFFLFYILQLSFQSLPGVTTMAISAEIYPSMVRGAAAGISAACGKLGATVGSYFFSELKNLGEIRGIFWTVFVTSALAILLTALSTPYYNGNTLDEADELARNGKPREAVKMLYGGPIANQDRTKGAEYVSDDLSDESDEQSA